MSHVAKIEKLEEKGKLEAIIKYATSKDAQDRAAAAKAMGIGITKESYTALINLLYDQEKPVRLNAIKSLQKLGREDAADHIRRANKDTTDAELIEAGKEALAALNKSVK